MSFYEERDREVARIVGHDVGDFPLQRLSEKYGIQFTEVESEVIQVMHKFIWIHYSDEEYNKYFKLRLPGTFQGTPLELWAIIMIYSASPSRLNPIIRLIVIPDSLFVEFEDINKWRDPPTPTVLSILTKICQMRPPIYSRGAFDGFLQFQNDRTPENIHNAIEKLSAKTDKYNPFTVHAQLKHVKKLTEAEMTMIRINYTQLLWQQYLSKDVYMAPACEEENYMEIWLVNSLLLYECPLKTGLESRNSTAIGMLAYYKYYPGHVYHKNDSFFINPITKSVDMRYDIMKKLPEMAELNLHQMRMWALTSALTRNRDSRRSPFMKLPAEINQLLQSYPTKDHRDLIAAWNRPAAPP